MPASQFGRAWLFMSGAVALHVLDEALTGFLDVYNPTIAALNAKLPWLPLRGFRFDVWLTGLIIAVALLCALSFFAFKGARWMRAAAYVLGGMMVVNALLHTGATILGRTVESVRFNGAMPGFYSSPLLFAAGLYLIYAAGRFRRPAAP